MKTTIELAGEPKRPTITTLAGLLARLVWVILGPMALLLLAAGIVTQGSGWLTWLDAAFLIVLGLMMLCRGLDQRSGASTTLTGEPATAEQYRRYVMILPIVGVVVWAGANLVGNHVLG